MKGGDFKEKQCLCWAHSAQVLQCHHSPSRFKHILKFQVEKTKSLSLRDFGSCGRAYLATVQRTKIILSLTLVYNLPGQQARLKQIQPPTVKLFLRRSLQAKKINLRTGLFNHIGLKHLIDCTILLRNDVSFSLSLEKTLDYCRIYTI